MTTFADTKSDSSRPLPVRQRRIATHLPDVARQAAWGQASVEMDALFARVLINVTRKTGGQ